MTLEEVRDSISEDEDGSAAGLSRSSTRAQSQVPVSLFCTETSGLRVGMVDSSTELKRSCFGTFFSLALISTEPLGVAIIRG